MNKWNRLLSYLDDVYGLENKLKSSFRKVGQTYDERTNEHIIQIEYRIRTGGGTALVKKKSDMKKGTGGKFLQDLLALSKSK